MKAIIHIGFPKTGTTTLQQFFGKNRHHFLRDQKVLYPRSCGKMMHFKLFLFLQQNESDANIFHSMSGEKLLELKKSFVTEFKKEIEDTKPELMIISSEYFPELTCTELSMLKDILSEVADGVKIIGYLRRQDKYKMSLYSTMVKSGYSEPIENFNHIVCEDYLQILERWEETFGHENIIIRPFERSLLINNDIIDDFISTVGLGSCQNYYRPQKQNSILSPDALSFLRQMNKFLPVANGKQLNSARYNISTYLEKLISQDAVAQQIELSMEKVEKFNADNVTIASRYTDGTRNSFFSDDIPDPVPNCTSGHNLTTDRIFEIFAFLWTALYNELFSKFQNQLGKNYYLQKNYFRAAECYKKSLALDPNNANAHYNISLICGVLGRQSDALKTCERAIALDPMSAMFHRYLQKLYLAAGDVEKAAEVKTILESLEYFDEDRRQST